MNFSTFAQLPKALAFTLPSDKPYDKAALRPETVAPARSEPDYNEIKCLWCVRLRKAFRKIYTKLVRELEKKFSGKVELAVDLDPQIKPAAIDGGKEASKPLPPRKKVGNGTASLNSHMYACPYSALSQM
ncbi:hypothetical protein COLO4_24294 [Corchorus olitorius]|uniref:Uncharacterized protein n=1 Tax=Corchorus olitorius TaxID=93759 RepID=A0A1R3IBH6_9ROSI|nr:hypothetical protein COLO4_24294 [Corchorus olitorius]